MPISESTTVEKYRVTMRNTTLLQDGNTADLEATDYVPTDILDAYVADARTRWQYVEVSEAPDFGPGGTQGETVIPDNLTPPTQE